MYQIIKTYFINALASKSFLLHRLTTAMGVLTEHPHLMERVFVSKEYTPFGIYALQLCLGGEWEDVIVDDRFPCDVENRMLFSKVKLLLFIFQTV